MGSSAKRWPGRPARLGRQSKFEVIDMERPLRAQQLPMEITPEMIEAGAAVVAGSLQLYDVDSPSLCANIAEDVLRVGLGVLLKKSVKN
jgi:hypothetical protein